MTPGIARYRLTTFHPSGNMLAMWKGKQSSSHFLNCFFSQRTQIGVGEVPT